MLGCCLANPVKANEYNSAKHAVINQPCQPGETIDQLLEHKHRNLFTDLGWRVFALKEGEYLVERAFMVSKGAELSYRWWVSAANPPKPANERTENLCAS